MINSIAIVQHFSGAKSYSDRGRNRTKQYNQSVSSGDSVSFGYSKPSLPSWSSLLLLPFLWLSSCDQPRQPIEKAGENIHTRRVLVDSYDAKEFGIHAGLYMADVRYIKDSVTGENRYLVYISSTAGTVISVPEDGSEELFEGLTDLELQEYGAELFAKENTRSTTTIDGSLVGAPAKDEAGAP